MKIEKIRKGFYTDGEKIYSYNGGACVWCEIREESENFLKSGNEEARTQNYGEEVKKVKSGMTFCNGQIVVIDGNAIEITKISPINPKYDGKGCCVSHDGYTEKKVIVKK